MFIDQHSNMDLAILAENGCWSGLPLSAFSLWVSVSYSQMAAFTWGAHKPDWP